MANPRPRAANANPGHARQREPAQAPGNRIQLTRNDNFVHAADLITTVLRNLPVIQTCVTEVYWSPEGFYEFMFQLAEYYQLSPDMFKPGEEAVRQLRLANTGTKAKQNLTQEEKFTYVSHLVYYWRLQNPLLTIVDINAGGKALEFMCQLLERFGLSADLIRPGLGARRRINAPAPVIQAGVNAQAARQAGGDIHPCCTRTHNMFRAINERLDDVEGRIDQAEDKALKNRCLCKQEGNKKQKKKDTKDGKDDKAVKGNSAASGSSTMPNPRPNGQANASNAAGRRRRRRGTSSNSSTASSCCPPYTGGSEQEDTN